MLSKKFSDFVFIGAVVFILVTVVVVRVLIFNQYDSRIENAENDIDRLEVQIAQVSSLVDNNRHDQLSSMVEMYEKVPDDFNGSYLLDYLTGMLELSEIEESDELNRQVLLHGEPAQFPEGTEFREVADQLTAYRFQITFDAENIDELITFINYMHDSEQIFVIQSLSYILPETPGDVIPVELYYVTFYASDVSIGE